MFVNLYGTVPIKKVKSSFFHYWKCRDNAKNPLIKKQQYYMIRRQNPQESTAKVANGCLPLGNGVQGKWRTRELN